MTGDHSTRPMRQDVCHCGTPPPAPPPDQRRSRAKGHRHNRQKPPSVNSQQSVAKHCCPSTAPVDRNGQARSLSRLHLETLSMELRQPALDDFSEPPRRAGSQTPIFIFCRILGPGHLRGRRRSVSVGFCGSRQLTLFWGRGSSQRAVSKAPPPPPKLKARPAQLEGPQLSIMRMPAWPPSVIQMDRKGRVLSPSRLLFASLSMELRPTAECLQPAHAHQVSRQ